MNADINLKSLVEQLEKSKVQAFSMLLYGPHGSGKEEFAQKLLDKLNLSYEEYSIADSEKTIQNKLLEMKQLLDAGAITQEDYDAVKKQLLGL